MMGRNRPGYKRPLTGEKRRIRQPLKIDRLPAAWQEQISEWLRKFALERVEGMTATLPWAKEPEATKLFPARRIGHTNLHRYRDLRMDQRDEMARQRIQFTERIVGSWSKLGLKDLPRALQNQVAAIAFDMQQAAGDGEEAKAAQLMLALNKILSEHAKAEVAKEKLALERKKIEVRKAGLEATSPREVYLQATEDLLKALRTRKGIREAMDPIQKELVEELSKRAESFAKRIEAKQA